MRKGQSHTKETRERISGSKKGKKLSCEGKKLSQTHKQHLKENHKGFLGLKHSLKTRKLLSEQRKGESGSNWQDGKSVKNDKIRKSLEYKLWREAVFKRDNYTCIWCGARSGNGNALELHADHIRPFAFFPELRFAIDNGRTLCIDCHKTTDTYGGKARKAYQTMFNKN